MSPILIETEAGDDQGVPADRLDVAAAAASGSASTAGPGS
jgi:hypothetical protein